jgi:hypothetical protein
MRYGEASSVQAGRVGACRRKGISRRDNPPPPEAPAAGLAGTGRRDQAPGSIQPTRPCPWLLMRSMKVGA